jgi:dipeptidyl aminopeptidase/acylaminoacyl peptidase
LWSPDSQWLLTHHTDERFVPETALIEHAPPGGGRPVLHTFKNSSRNDPLPRATYVAIHVPSGRIVRFEEFRADVPNLSPFFLKMAWFSGRARAWVIRWDRYWKKVDLICFDLTPGSGRVVLSETAETGYLDLYPFIFGRPNVRTLDGSEEIIWFSERDGWGHLYLYDASTGSLKNQITKGRWLVREIVHVDERKRQIFFLAGGIDPEADPAHRSLCTVNLDGTDFKVLLAHEKGDLYVPLTEPAGLDQNYPFRPSRALPGFSPDGRFAVVRYSSAERGNKTEIVDLRTRTRFRIASVAPTPNEVRARHFTALAADGETLLHGTMFLPSDFDETRRYPLIDYIYPGPHLAHQPQSFGLMNATPATTLAELGFVTIMLDSRGVPLRSRGFHQVGYPAVLEPQLADHAGIVRQLCERFSFLDVSRIGMIGYSAGGSATMRALCEYGETFKVGVSVCGFDDPAASAACWADKYCGPESQNSAERTSAIACKLQGKLLLISGDLDENVRMSQTLSVVDALVRANRDFDLLIVPNERHYLLLTSGYVQRRVWDFFVRHLLGGEPPVSFAIKFEPSELARFEACLRREYFQ